MSTNAPNRELTLQVVDFLEHIGIDVSFKRFTTDNVQIRCPFARISGHRDGVDSNPSLGMKITQDKGFMWHCFTCGRKGRSLIGFIKELQTTGVISDATEAYRLQNAIQVKFPDFYDDDDTGEKQKAYSLDSFVKATHSRAAITYHTKKRRIANDVADDCSLYFDRAHHQVVFPCYSYEDDKLHGWVAHYITGRKPKYSNNFYTGDFLYLEWLIDATSVIVVEGMYDAIKIYSHLKALNMLHAYSVVGTFGSEVSMRQVDKLVQKADRVLLMGDNDDAGIKMEQRIFTMIRRRNPFVYKLPYVGKDPDEVSLKAFVGVIKSRVPFRSLI
jgi:DNA primase